MTEPDPHPIYTALKQELRTSGWGTLEQADSPTEPADDADHVTSS